MSTRLKLNVKNVILGCHNFCEILARHDTSIYSGFSRLVKPSPYYRQENVRTNTSNHAEAVLPRSFDNVSLKPITSEIPFISNRFDKVQTGRIHIAGCGLPWESPIRLYYDKKTPKCPPPCPKIHKDCVDPPVPPCPPIAASPKCPVKPKCYPCKPKKNPCAKSIPCTLKTFPLHNCRFFSGNPCQPKAPTSRPSKPRFCRPKRQIDKPTPKCASPAHCGPKSCKPSGTSNPCNPKFGGSGGGGGDPCACVKAAPKECYTTPGKCGGGKAPHKKGPICPK